MKNNIGAIVTAVASVVGSHSAQAQSLPLVKELAQAAQGVLSGVNPMKISAGTSMPPRGRGWWVTRRVRPLGRVVEARLYNR